MRQIRGNEDRGIIYLPNESSRGVSVIDALRGGLDAILDPDNWTRLTIKDDDGRHCAVGALMAEGPVPGIALEYLERASRAWLFHNNMAVPADLSALAYINDHCGHQAVIDVYRTAIAMALEFGEDDQSVEPKKELAPA